MKHQDAAALLRLYAGIYLLAFMAVLCACTLMIAQPVALQLTTRSSAIVLSGGVLALLLVAASGLRLLEFGRLRHIPGPSPGFFLGNLKSLLLHEHGARDKALLELHETYGPVVKLRMAWGCRPFVSVAEVPRDIRQTGIDSNRRADATVLPNSLMGLALGDKHRSHRQQINPHFTPKAVDTRGLRRRTDLPGGWRHGRDELHRCPGTRADVAES